MSLFLGYGRGILEGVEAQLEEGDVDLLEGLEVGELELVVADVDTGSRGKDTFGGFRAC